MTQKEAIAKAPSGRVRRTPVGRRNVLTLSGKEPGYEYRYVNDIGDRVQQFLDAGYELVEAKNVQIGDSRIGRPSAEGSNAQASVGNGVKAFAMRIREDWYAEDQAAKQAHVKAIEDATKEKALDGTYGKLEISKGS
jgi:hypothetical protein